MAYNNIASKYLEIGDKFFTVGEGSQLQQISERDILGRRGDVSGGATLDLIRKEGDLTRLDPGQLTIGAGGEFMSGGNQISLGGSAAYVPKGFSLDQFGTLPVNQDFNQYLQDTNQTYQGGQFSGIQPVAQPSSVPRTYEQQQAALNAQIPAGTPAAAQQQGIQAGTLDPVTGRPFPQQEIQGLNAQANDLQSNELNEILSQFGKVDVSKSTELLDRISGALASPTSAPPKPPNLQELFASEKQKLGIAPLEQNLANIDQQLSQLDADFSSGIEDEERRLVSTREMSRNLSDKEIAYNRKKRDLMVEKESLASQITAKYNSLELVTSLIQQDFANSSAYFNQEFDRALQMFNLARDVDKDKQDENQKALDNYRANAQVVINTMLDTGTTYGQLSDSQKLNLQNLGLQAGLGQNFFSDVLAAGQGKEILTHVISDDKTYATIVYKDGTTDMIRTGLQSSGGAGGLNTAQINSTINQIAGSFDNEPIVKNFNLINEGYQFAKSLSNTTTNPSDDQALIYAFAKAMDPTSVVREGEYATVQKYAQSWVSAYGKSITQAVNGTGFLSTEARTNIKKTIEQRYNASKQNYQNVYDQYQQRISNVQGGGFNTLTDYSTNNQAASPLDDLADDINTSGSQYNTREELINALIPLYKELTPDQIANQVYTLIPDK